MAKKKGNEGWLIAAVGLGVGLLFLYYRETGLGKENNAALIPDTIEDEVDNLVSALNDKFGKAWVNVGLAVVTRYVQNALPASYVALVGVVIQVENISKHRFMTSYEKQQLAIQMAHAS